MKKRLKKIVRISIFMCLCMFILGIVVDKKVENQDENVVDKTTPWNLMVVNKWNSLDEDYETNLKELSNGHSVDERCYDDLVSMIDDCRNAGLQPVICSSYRSYEKQEQLYNNKIEILIAQGYTKKQAVEEAGKSVALPGTSEHQMGLAVDIVDMNNQNLDESQESTDVQKWLMANSYKYGFILRYPNGKSSITGIIYEPWHYRYVGKEDAIKIYESGLCLEEYVMNIYS